MGFRRPFKWFRHIALIAFHRADIIVNIVKFIQAAAMADADDDAFGHFFANSSVDTGADII